MFHKLDLDGGGTIEEDELKHGLLTAGKVLTPIELKQLMNEVRCIESTSFLTHVNNSLKQPILIILRLGG